MDDDTWQYATIPRRCVWVSGGAGTSEARTHARARARTRTVWASVNAAQRAHPRPRHAHTQSALHDTDRGNQRMATMKNQMVQAQVSRKNFSLRTFFSKSNEDKFYSIFRAPPFLISSANIVHAIENLRSNFLRRTKL